jgi:hypothetical protein
MAPSRYDADQNRTREGNDFVSGGAAPLANIELRDGSWLRIAADGVHHGDRVAPLAKIQDARQVSPNPLTIALRVAGMGLLEFEPKDAGEGLAALEALYRLRPELRPVGFGATDAGFAPVGGLPYTGYPVAAPYGGPGIAPPTPSPWGPFAGAPGFPPPTEAGYYPQTPAMTSLRARGLLTPFPRRFGELLGAIFQLYAGRLSIWLLLGLCIAPITGILDGAWNYLFFTRIVQVNQSSATLSPTSCVLPAYHVETGSALVRDGIVVGVLLLLSLLFTGLQTAVISVGAREVTLNRPVSVRRSLLGGLKRWRPTVGASFLAGGAYYLALLPAAASYVVLFKLASGTNLCVDSTATNAVLSLGCLGSVFFIVGVIAAALFAVRMGFAPYLAATHQLGVRASVARSWQITRGHFWRTFGVILMTGGLAWLVLQIASAFPPAIAVFVATPIVYIFTVPFIALTYITLLYDLLLRHEGYTALAEEEMVPTSTTSAGSTPPAPIPPL